MMAAARDTDRSQTSVRSKIYFFGTLMAKDDPKALSVLEVRVATCLVEFHKSRWLLSASFPAGFDYSRVCCRLD